MDRAIVGVCHSPRQRRILRVTLPTWQRYAERHGIPVRVLEQSHAGADYYWTKHLLYRVPELRRYKCLLFLDNDVFIAANAGPLLSEWNSPLIGATFESTQANWSAEVVAQYYRNYAVDCSLSVDGLGVINSGVLVLPQEQASFLESVYKAWQGRMRRISPSLSRRQAPFVRAADQPHVSYALQAERRFTDFGESFNRLWWHWFHKNVSKRPFAFLLRSKTAALTLDLMPWTAWSKIFRHERALFAKARNECDFLHVAGSKSPVFLGTQPTQQTE